MAGRKVILANILFNSNLIGLFKRLPLKNKLIVLNYHRIRPDDPDYVAEFDEGVFTTRASQFIVQMKWLVQNTHVLAEDDLIEVLKTKRRFSQPTVLITFDDGYRDNYTLAYPALKKYNLPAIFFISTQLIDMREVGWWDTIAYLVKKSPLREVFFKEHHFDLEKDRQAAINFFQQRMKLEKYEHTRHMLEDLTRLFDVDFPGRDLQDQQLMTWDQILEMSNNIVAIGAHTHSHRVLATLDATAQREEMILSKLILEKKTGRKICSIAYPVGGPDHFTMETTSIAQDCGYMLGFTCDSGVNTWDIDDVYTIKRVSGLLEDIRTVSAFIMLPEVFLWDKAVAKHRKVLQEHPDYADFSFSLGLIYMGQGKLEKAITAFTEALNHNANYVEARIKLGISQAYGGDYHQAAQNFETVLENHPNYADVHYLLGIVQSARGNDQDAINCFERAVAINPAYKDAQLKLGVMYLKAGRHETGLLTLENASRLDLEDDDLRRICEMGRDTSAHHDGSPQALLEALNTRLFGGADQVSLTVQEFSHHIEISPNLSDMLSIITTHSESDDALDVLVPLFEEYVRQYPSYSDLHNIFGLLYRKLDRLDEAVQCFRTAIGLSPKFLKAHLNLFEALKQQGRLEEALEASAYPVSCEVPYADVYSNLAEVLLGLGKLAEAKARAQKALEINPRYHRARLVLARIYRQSGEIDKARRAVDDLLAGDPPLSYQKDAQTLLKRL